MKSEQAILNKILDLCKRDLPTLLTYAELADFVHYQLGASKVADALGLYVSRATYQHSIDRQSIQIIITLQLPKCSEETCSQYDDIVKGYIFSISPTLLGFDKLESLNVDSWSPTTELAAITFIDVTWSHENDDCDLEDYGTVLS